MTFVGCLSKVIGKLTSMISSSRQQFLSHWKASSVDELTLGNDVAYDLY